MDSIKRQDLVEMLDEGEFLTILSKAKIQSENKITIIKDRREWQRQQILAGRPHRKAEMTVDGIRIAIGERFIDPLTGRQRVNMGR